MFLFGDSPIHICRFRAGSILIPATFLGLTVLYELVTILAPEWLGQPADHALDAVSLFWLYRQVGQDSFRRVDLPLGDGWGTAGEVGREGSLRLAHLTGETSQSTIRGVLDPEYAGLLGTGERKAS